MMQRSEIYRILDSRKTVLRCSLALVLVILVAGEAISLAQQQADFTLARGRVGTLTIGMTAEEVIGVFGKPRVKRVDLQREGMSTPALEIRLGGLSAARASLTAELFPPAHNRVWRVSVLDRRFRTAVLLPPREIPK